MKALILSCNTGQGHNAAGRAMMERFAQRNIPCEMLDALSFASPRYSRLICDIHEKAYRRVPGLYGKGYAGREHGGAREGKSMTYLINAIYAKRLHAYIQDNGFDTVIAPHVFPAEALTYIERNRAPALHTFFVATDYTCSPYVGETELDAYFIPHASLLEEFRLAGLPIAKLIPAGIPVGAAFCGPGDRQRARHTLGLPAGPLVLIATGSMGCGDPASIVAALRLHCPDAAVVTICGTNEKSRAALSKAYAGEDKVFIVGFTDTMSLYMDAADVLITKAGGLTSTEAAAKALPIVHVDAVPGCETRNLRFFTQRGMSVTGADADQLAVRARWLLQDATARNRMGEAQRMHVDPFAAAAICERIMELCGVKRAPG